MTPVFRSLALTLVMVLITAIPPHVNARSTGGSDANIVFGSSRHGEGPGTSSQAGETSATSVQRTTGDGQQTNQGDARAVSVQQQRGLGGATQTTNNQGVVRSLQGAGGGGGGGGGGGQQVSNNQVNIQSNQQQQNVEGSLINVQGGNEGLVIVNTNERTGRQGGIDPIQQPVYDDNTLLNVVDNNEIVLVITAEETEEEPPPSSQCRYVCIRSTNNAPYCCDDGSNRRGRPAIHGGTCPPLRFLCTRNVFFMKCAHDGQCAKSDKCCYDDCAQHHICKRADLAK